MVDEKSETWVAVTHYGWRISMFTIFPNATKVKQVTGPDTFLIPWFNIFFFTLWAIIFITIWRIIRKWKKKNVDPVTDKIGKELEETQSGFKKFMQRWFSPSK